MRSPLFVAVIAVALGLFGAVRCIGDDLVLGFAALLGSVLALRLAPGVWSAPFEPRPARSDWFALAAVFATLVFFRFYRMEPPGLWGDDALNGLLAFDVLDGAIGSPFQIIQHSHSLFHALTNYVIAASFQIFGAGLPALRLPGIVAGCAAGLFVYGIARRLFGQPLALIAGLFFATSPMQLAHAKSLTQVVLGLALQTAGVYALVRAVQSRSSRWLVAASLPLAMTIYTYHAAKVAPLIALPLIAEGLRSGALRRRSVALAALAFAALLIPAAVSFWHQPLALFGRAQAVSIFDEVRQSGTPWPLVVSVAKTLGVFQVEQGPQYNWFGPGDDPALTPLMAALVLHGLLASLVGWRQPRHRLLLFWFALGVAPAVFSTEAPRGYRTLMASPPLFLWAAMPLAALWQTSRDGTAARALRALVVALVCASLLFDFTYYFRRTYSHPRSRWTLGERIVEMARIARGRGPGWTAYVMSPTFTAQHESLRLLSRMWGLDIRDAPSLHFALEGAPLPERGAVFLTAPGSHEAAGILRHRLPQTRRVARRDPQSAMWWWGGSWPYETQAPYHDAIAIGIIAPRSSLASYRDRPHRAPVEVRCKSERGRAHWREVVPFYDFFSDTFAEPSTCEWRAAIWVPRPEPRTLHISADQNLAITVDGTAYREGKALRPGRHEIGVVTREATRHVALKMRWKTPSGIELVPARAWRAPARRPPGGRPSPRN